MARSTARTPHQLTFVVLAAGVAAYALLQSLVTPVLPTIQEELHTSQSSVTWVLTAYLLSASIFTPILGRVGDMVGKERMFVATLAALSLGSLLAAVATSIDVMILARVIQGIGGAVLPLAFGIIRDEFPKEKVAGAVGVIAALTAVGAGLGIVLAGPIVDALSYHWLFWIPMIVTVLAAIGAHLFVPESPVRTPGRIGFVAPVLLSGWLVALLVAVSQAESWGWGSPKVVGLIVLAVIIAVVWVVVEDRSEHPLIDMKMMRVPAVWTTNLVALLFGIGMYAVFAFLPAFLQTQESEGYGFGLSVTSSGLLLLPMTVMMFVLGLVSGRLAHRFGSKAVLVAGSALSVIPFVMLTVAHDETWEIGVAMALIGVGFGMAFAAMSNLIVAAVPPQQTGVASGMNANIRTIGGSLGAAIMSSIVTAGATADGVPKESGYTLGFGVLAGAAVLATVAAVFVPVLRAARAGAGTGDGAGGADGVEELPHPELALVAAGTVRGDEPE
ncbi:MFS transporter [Patulibacter sp. NPDC049589]|uniref:MFS transporter n=1 Tax=Patulibacter sp. NPDC049589 TaxID=3154731 RepID=UPI00343A17AC